MADPSPPRPSWLAANGWAAATSLLYALLLLLSWYPLIAGAWLSSPLLRQNPSAPSPVEYAKTILWLDDPGTAGMAWASAGMLALACFALLALPVRRAQGRPVRRRHILIPAAATGALLTLLTAGLVLSACDGFTGGMKLSPWTDEAADGAGPLLALAGVWLFWAAILAKVARCAPDTWTDRAASVLLAGSALELLIALPCHILARNRGECCAGLLTTFGLAAGWSVMLLAFGPAVFLLFQRRWERLRP